MTELVLWLTVLALPRMASAAGAGVPPSHRAPRRDSIAAVERSPQKTRLRVMPLGDSITFGTPDREYGGYRHLLGTLLANDGYSVEFVGSRQSGEGFAGGPANEGHPGWTIPQLKSAIDSERWLEDYRPDVVLLHIGTNDIRREDAASAPGHLSALLDDILGRLPRVDVIVAQVIPYRRGPEPGHRTYNAAIPGIVAPRGARVSMVDMQTILSPSDYADGFHPNAGGYDKMARAWEPVRPRALDGVDQADHAPAGRDTARCAGSR